MYSYLILVAPKVTTAWDSDFSVMLHMSCILVARPLVCVYVCYVKVSETGKVLSVTVHK